MDIAAQKTSNDRVQERRNILLARNFFEVALSQAFPRRIRCQLCLQCGHRSSQCARMPRVLYSVRKIVIGPRIKAKPATQRDVSCEPCDLVDLDRSIKRSHSWPNTSFGSELSDNAESYLFYLHNLVK